jgi:type IV pilus assembly protein PilO
MTVTTENTNAQRLQGVSEKTRELLTKLNLYYAGVGILALLNLYLLIHIAFAWSAAHSHDEAALAQQRVTLKAAEIATKPLQGLDGKLTKATEQADAFYQKRLPYAYSQVAGELGALAKKQGVKMTHVQYAQAPVLQSGTSPLTEVRIDASLSGDYRPLVLFVNSLERDKMFFLIKGVALSGQQSGTVGLRLGLTTYLRAPVGKEGTDKDVALTDDSKDSKDKESEPQ